MTPSIQPNKSFWSKPEGKTAGLINIVLIFLGVYFWGSIVPFVLAAAENTLHLIIVCVAIAAILYVALDGNFRRMLWYMYRSVMRWVTQWFVNIDPIGILKTYKEKMQAKKDELDGSLGEIRGQRAKTEKSLRDNERSYNESMSKFTTAQDRLAAPGVSPELQHQARRIMNIEGGTIADLEKLVAQQKGHMQRYDSVVGMLARYSEVCEDHIIKFGRQIKIREQARDASKSFRKGMAAAMGILRGLPEQEEADMAIDALENDYARAMGEVENAINLTKNAVTQADFSDMVAIERATELAGQLKTGGPAQIAAPAAAIKIDEQAAKVEVHVDEFDRFFK